jgi:hypothetical protein
MNLRVYIVVARHDFPSFNNVKTQEISFILLVKGAAIEASDSERDIPTSAVFKALQSLAPSPHIPINI